MEQIDDLTSRARDLSVRLYALEDQNQLLQATDLSRRLEQTKSQSENRGEQVHVLTAQVKEISQRLQASESESKKCLDQIRVLTAYVHELLELPGSSGVSMPEVLKESRESPSPRGVAPSDDQDQVAPPELKNGLRDVG
ncbi:MAG: hypothetical protein N2C14_03975 [Planctomycetales bacterium]